MANGWIGALVTLSLLVAGCGGDGEGGGGGSDGGAECGDGVCEASEREACPEDCSGDVDGGGITCAWRGGEYEPGVTFPAGDGCNTCTCSADGDVSCTEIACDPSEDCRTDEDCSDVPSGYCTPPGSSGSACGIGCGVPSCATNDECTGGTGDEVCHHAEFTPYESTTGRCGAPCDEVTGGTSCAEGNRCADDGACWPVPCDAGYECPEGRRCAPTADATDEHGCEPIPCDEGYECPSQTTCDPSAAGHGCRRLSCETDDDCEGSGYCVLGSCYESLGSCEQPAP